MHMRHMPSGGSTFEVALIEKIKCAAFISNYSQTAFTSKSCPGLNTLIPQLVAGDFGPLPQNATAKSVKKPTGNVPMVFYNEHAIQY